MSRDEFWMALGRSLPMVGAGAWLLSTVAVGVAAAIAGWPDLIGAWLLLSLCLWVAGFGVALILMGFRDGLGKVRRDRSRERR